MNITRDRPERNWEHQRNGFKPLAPQIFYLFSRFTDGLGCLIRRGGFAQRVVSNCFVSAGSIQGFCEMGFDKRSLAPAVEAALADGKGKRKFTQSVDVAINFTKDVDFKKPETRLNLEVALPHPANTLKIAVFADGELALNAKKAGADFVYNGSEILGIAGNKEKLGQLLECAVLASPQLMAAVGKSLGQVLSGKGRLPKPIMPNSNLAELFERTRASVIIKSKGKYLPCAHCIVGKETMAPGEIVENTLAILEGVFRKLTENQVQSIYFKTTMGKAFKVGG